MTFKQFVGWCNERACDGRWTVNTFMICTKIMEDIRRQPFWKRKKAWLKIADEVERDIVSVINKKYGIEEGGGE